MKVTIDLDEALLVKAQVLAARHHVSLTRLVEEGLRLRLTAESVRLPVHHGEDGLAPGLDGSSNKALLDAADRN